jgi:hypothetical protein
MYVSSYYRSRGLSHTHLPSYYYIGLHTTIYVSSYYYICVLILQYQGTVTYSLAFISRSHGALPRDPSAPPLHSSGTASHLPLCH